MDAEIISLEPEGVRQLEAELAGAHGQVADLRSEADMLALEFGPGKGDWIVHLPGGSPWHLCDLDGEELVSAADPQDIAEFAERLQEMTVADLSPTATGGLSVAFDDGTALVTADDEDACTWEVLRPDGVVISCRPGVGWSRAEAAYLETCIPTADDRHRRP